MNNENCKSCGWHEANNIHAVAHVGFFSYCNRCHDRIIKEARKQFKEKQKKLEELNSSKPVQHNGSAPHL